MASVHSSSADLCVVRRTVASSEERNALLGIYPEDECDTDAPSIVAVDIHARSQRPHVMPTASPPPTQAELRRVAHAQARRSTSGRRAVRLSHAESSRTRRVRAARRCSRSTRRARRRLRCRFQASHRTTTTRTRRCALVALKLHVRRAVKPDAPTVPRPDSDWRSGCDRRRATP